MLCAIIILIQILSELLLGAEVLGSYFISVQKRKFVILNSVSGLFKYYLASFEAQKEFKDKLYIH